VLEESGRLGGRLFSEPRGEGWLNLGAHVFGSRDSALGQIVDAVGATSLDLSGRLAAVALGERIVATGPVETYPARLPLSLRSRVSLARAGLKLRIAVARYGRVAERRLNEHPAAHQRRILGFMDDRSFADFLGAVSSDVDALFRATLNRSSGEPEELAAGYGIGYFHLVWNRSAGLSRGLLGGPATVIDGLARGLQGRTRLHTEVVRIERARPGARVIYRGPAGEHSVTARAVIVATPAYVAHRVIRELPADTAAALEGVRYGPYVVGAVLTDEPRPVRWDDIYALATPGRSFNMLFNIANVVRRGQGPREPWGSLMVYAAAGQARELDDLADSEVASRFEQDLLTLYPELHGRIRELVIRRWPRGLPYASVGRARLQEPLMRPLDPIFLAGDYLGTWYSETATWTGKAAADGARELLATEPSKVPA